MDVDKSLTEELVKNEKENETLAENERIIHEEVVISVTDGDSSFSDEDELTTRCMPKSTNCAPANDAINVLYQAVPELANHFSITCKIGEGAFSCVYLAQLKHYPEVKEMFALKHIIPTTHPSRIQNELNCLLKIGGCDNVIDIKLCLRHRDHVVFVMPIFLHDKFQDYLYSFGVDEAREYMKNLLIALRRVHQFNIIHRDIKPSNFLYNRQQKRYALVDFGLASGPMLIDRDADKLRKTLPTAGAPPSDSTIRVALSPSKFDPSCSRANVYKCKKPSTAVKNQLMKKKDHPSFDSSHICDCFGKAQVCSVCVARPNQVAARAGTAGFRSPEVLMKYTEQGTAVDIWSAGVIFLSILSARYPFFRAEDDIGYLAQIISVLGSEPCVQAASSIGKHLLLSEPVEAVDLKAMCTKLRMSQMSVKLGTSSQFQQIVKSWKAMSDEPYDLLSKMLDPNPHTRITAEDALNHPYFTNS
ncbi:cell division cycle 7-related protein kinase-like [Biomphalaria glabrata]|uniref:non-specific serine/threonine protein kinase n=2 Tax=Biomphalaria glabrata TaxID=6526 RepID=A0A9W3BBE5_BIOGL|nr:cell division cycle 7-related protein kinase-like [Biomphalaria glabrata]